MKKLLLVVVVAFPALAFSQQADPVLFKERMFDFGEIRETGGPAEHDFVFTNNSGRPLKIISVQASCGCTTPGWTKEAVAPGKNGFVKASFDPKGRPGYFNKSLTVTTDYDGVPVVLQIKGQVITGKESDPKDWPAAKGALRLRVNSFNLGQVFINKEPKAKEFAVFNASDKPITFGKVTGPGYVKVETPAVLNPKETGVIRILFDVKQKKQYGFVSENVELETDDPELPVKPFSVYATLEEFFPALSGEELDKAPVLKPNLVELDFGRLSQGTDANRELTLKNEGKKDLIIRAIQTNCTCLSAEPDQMTLRPGAEGKLSITLKTQGRAGTQQKAITIYSTDPRNPVQRITVVCYVQ